MMLIHQRPESCQQKTYAFPLGYSNETVGSDLLRSRHLIQSIFWKELPHLMMKFMRAASKSKIEDCMKSKLYKPTFSPLESSKTIHPSHILTFLILSLL